MQISCRQMIWNDRPKALKDIRVILNTHPMFTVYKPHVNGRKLILKILFCKNTPTANQSPKTLDNLVGNFLNVPKRQSCLKLITVVNNFHSFGGWNDFTDVKHKLKLRLVCTHLNSTYISCAVHSLCMKMINYKPWTKSEATALLIIFVWKENHTAELALCVYIHYEFI